MATREQRDADAAHKQAVKERAQEARHREWARKAKGDRAARNTAEADAWAAIAARTEAEAARRQARADLPKAERDAIRAREEAQSAETRARQLATRF